MDLRSESLIITGKLRITGAQCDSNTIRLQRLAEHYCQRRNNMVLFGNFSKFELKMSAEKTYSTKNGTPLNKQYNFLVRITLSLSNS